MTLPWKNSIALLAGLSLMIGLSACAAKKTPGPASASTDTGSEAANADQKAAPMYIEPYLQNPEPGKMTIIWWTEESAPDSVVDYRKGESSMSKAATDEYVEEFGLWRHRATLTGLEPAQSYIYRARSGERLSGEYSFRSAPPRDADLSLRFLGDGRTDSQEIIARHRSLMDMSKDADLLFELGDTVYLGRSQDWMTYMRRILTASDPDDPGSTAGSLVPALHLVGNHEIAYTPDNPPEDAGDAYYYSFPDDAMSRFKDLFVHPPNGNSDPKWHELYYAVDYGAATFIFLDGNNTSEDSLDNHDYLVDGSTPDWQPDSEQYRWLEAQLERAQRKSVLTIVMSHPSPYSSGVHGTPDKEIDAQRGYELRALDPLFRKYGVDAMISSHDHLAERSLVGPNGSAAEDPADESNINYFVIGNSGSSSRKAQEGWEQWMSVNGDGQPPYYRQWHYDWAGDDRYASMLELDMSNNDDGTWTIGIRVRRNDGAAFDEIKMIREDPLAAP